MWKIKSVVIAIAPVLISLLIGLYYNNNNRKCINPPGVVKYWPFLKKMWNKNDNLRTMKRVFDRLGNEMVNGSVDPDWDVMWSIEYPFIMFSNQMKNLKPHQKVNHFPGIGVIAHKAYMTTHNKLPFIPAAFEFPRMYDEFKSFAEINPDRKFVIKNGDNRGVKVMSIDKMNFKESSGTFIQEFIANPLLIDGHLFDMGVYVLISSINPLRIYRFKSEVLLNFCTDPYYPFDPENVKKYVIRNERKPVFEMYSLRDMILKMGFSLKKSFETHYESLGGDVEGLWNQIDDAIVSLLLRNEEHIIKTTSNFGSTDHFFELVRIDFMIDDNFVAHLIEVNMSPNLTPAEDKYLRLGPGYEQLVFHTLQCVLGLSSNHHLRWAVKLSSGSKFCILSISVPMMTVKPR